MGNYRNPKLLKLAAKAPHCMCCGAHNEGQVVACHSNKQRHGRGMGYKAHDLCMFGCMDCHDQLDGRRGSLTREEKDFMFYEGFYQTVLWLLQEGHLEVKA